MSDLLIVGSRLSPTLDRCFHIFDNASYVFDCAFDRIISGGADGVDSAAALWAASKAYPFREFLPDWVTHGRRAGFLRNKTMVETCSAAIVVWDGRSKGTKLTFDLLMKSDKPFVMVRYEGAGL